MEIKFWPKWKNSPEWKAWLPDRVERKYWAKIFDQMYRQEIDTWDYPWTASVWFHDGLTATPNVNLVSNIGFGLEATHTASGESPLAEMATHELSVINHPSAINQNIAADRYAFDHIFTGRYQRFPFSALYLPKRITSGIYRRFKRCFA